MTKHMTASTSFARSVLLASVCAFALCGTAMAQEAQHNFEIPAEPAADALRDFAKQANKRLVFPEAAVAGKQAPAISGTLSDSDVLGRLATAAGLVVVTNDGTTITLKSAGDTASTNDRQIVEVVVTATHSESLASKTPITLTAITGDKLESAGITNPTQLMQVVPNLFVDRGNANGLGITIRGISSTGVSAPTAAFLLNGIYIPDANIQEVSFFDLDRVEVLRGPQGTLYGRNTTAGVLNVISAVPKPFYSAYIDADFGSYNAKQITGMINVPVNDKLQLRFAANYDARDSYYKQVVAQPWKEPEDKDNKSVRVTALYKPTSTMKLLVSADYTSLTGVGTGFGSDPLISNFYQTPIEVPASGVRDPDPVYLHPSAEQALAKTYADGAPFHVHDDTWGLTSQFDWSLPDNLTLTWLGGYRQFSRNDSGSVFWGTSYDSNGNATNVVNTSSTTSLHNSNSQELRLAYNGDKLKIQGGLYYFHDHQGGSLFFGNFGLPTIYGIGQSVGEFVQATYSVTDRWRVTAGVRNTQDSGANAGKSELVFPWGTLVLNSSATTSKSSKVTWKVETDYDITPSVYGYAMVATGYKAGGNNGNCLATNTPCTILPEDVTDYEAGIKAKLLDRSLMLNADIFHYDYTNLQIGQIAPETINGQSVPSAVTTNAAAAKDDGVEVEGAYIPFAHNRLDFSATYLDARYTKYDLSTSSNSGSFAGAPLNDAPRYTLSAGYSYTQPLSNGGSVVASLHWLYSDKYAILNTSTNSQFWQPAYAKTDFSLQYNSAKGGWYVQAYVKNIEDRVTVTYINTAPQWPADNNGTVNTADPRTYGVRLGAKF